MDAPAETALRVGVVGPGRIGGLLLRAAARYAPAVSLAVAGRDPESCEALRRDLPALRVETAPALAAWADLLMLAVPPEAYAEVLRGLGPALAPGCILVSLTNGVPLVRLAALVPNPIVKVIPTMAHAVGRGTALVMAGPRAEPRHLDRVLGFLDAFSRPVLVDDRDNRVASNVAGSYLALAAAFTDAFVEANAARALTLGRPALDRMAAEALGAVGDLVLAGHSFADIARATATPGGVTEAALAAMAGPAAALASELVEVSLRHQAAMLAGAPAAG